MVLDAVVWITGNTELFSWIFPSGRKQIAFVCGYDRWCDGELLNPNKEQWDLSLEQKHSKFEKLASKLWTKEDLGF